MVLAQQEGINMSEELEAIDNDINIRCEVKLESKDGIATVAIPPELRLTQRLVNFLHAAVQQRGLELKHWVITTPEQEKELENLPNVSMEKEE